MADKMEFGVRTFEVPATPKLRARTVNIKEIEER